MSEREREREWERGLKFDAAYVGGSGGKKMDVWNQFDCLFLILAVRA